MALSTRDEYVQKFIEAVQQRTPSNIQNEGGFDFTIGAPLRGFGEGLCAVTAIAENTAEAEIKKQARETMFLLAGVEQISASKANGVLSITSTQTITILEGEPVYSTETGGKVAEVLEDVSFTDIETKDVRIIADEAGSDVSFDVGTLFITADNQSGSNLIVINNGTDAETDYERTSRIQAALKAKAHGTAPAILTAAAAVTVEDEFGIVIESVKDVFMSFPWKHQDPETLGPDQLGEIVMYIQSSLGVPSTDLLDAIQLELTGNDELDGKQGAGQNIDLRPVETTDVAFVVPYKRAAGGVHDTIETDIQSAITNYVTDLNQGDAINPTDWQATLLDIEGVEYYDEANMTPATIQTIESYKIWNITSITVTEI